MVRTRATWKPKPGARFRAFTSQFDNEARGGPFRCIKDTGYAINAVDSNGADRQLRYGFYESDAVDCFGQRLDFYFKEC